MAYRVILERYCSKRPRPDRAGPRLRSVCPPEGLGVGGKVAEDGVEPVVPLVRRRRPVAQEPDHIGALQGADGGELQTSQMELGRVYIDRKDLRHAHRQQRERHIPGADNREHAVRGPEIQRPGLRTLVLLREPEVVQVRHHFTHSHSG